MNILLDPQIFWIQKYGGISRLFTEIYKELSDVHNVSLPIFYSENLHLKEYGLGINTLSCIHSVNFKAKYRLINTPLNKINQYVSNHSIQRKQFDVFCATNFNPYFLQIIGNKPFVLTVYDMIHELFPQYFSSESDKVTIANKKQLMEKATRIIAISQSTKNDIIQLYPHINSGKIEVVYLSQSIQTKTVDVVKKLPQKYLLFVGNRGNYKNFVFFFKAVSDILQKDNTLHLVCAGGGKFTQSELQLIYSAQVQGQVIQHDFKDSELSIFYKNAVCFIFPSEYEGFGIPVLEAMVCGCPVILAKHSSFPEVAGEAGVYFKLNDPFSLREQVNLLVTNRQQRQKYVEKGISQATKFSWQKTTQQYLNIFQAIVNLTHGQN